jgi:NAD(P) transhydrogenase subunit alpha
MRLVVLKERRAGETRVAATPETVKKLVLLGLTVVVEEGAGAGASISDADYKAAGAELAAGSKAALEGAGVVLAVQLPGVDEMNAVPRGALLVCISGLMADKPAAHWIANRGVDLAAMELLPRITRAQSMDVLSSQANLAGYRSVIEGAFAFDRGFPMMMTAAGTVPPARVFVMGAGVAGLQAIATARRLGAIVSATDVRPAAKEEIRSLGATFVGVEDAETAKQTGAYATELSDDFRRKQAELIATTVAKNDMVICTALVQGGKAPTLVTKAMVESMKPGSVIVDLASDGGGNCELTRPGEAYVTDNGVKILGYRNWPGRIGVAASTLYAKNLLTFITNFWDKDTKAPKLPPDDDIVKGVMVTRGGAVIHPAFAGVTATAPNAQVASSAPPKVEPLPAAEDAPPAVLSAPSQVTAPAVPAPKPEASAATLHTSSQETPRTAAKPAGSAMQAASPGEKTARDPASKPKGQGKGAGPSKPKGAAARPAKPGEAE